MAARWKLTEAELTALQEIRSTMLGDIGHDKFVAVYAQKNLLEYLIGLANRNKIITWTMLVAMLKEVNNE